MKLYFAGIPPSCRLEIRSILPPVRLSHGWLFPTSLDAPLSWSSQHISYIMPPYIFLLIIAVVRASDLIPPSTSSSLSHISRSLNASRPIFCRYRHRQQLRLQYQWTADLEALCLETADERTCLEATAYSAWMSGNLLLEKEAWREALDRYSTAHRICEELGKVRGTPRAQKFVVDCLLGRTIGHIQMGFSAYTS